MTPEEKFDDFRVEVIDRLARIETLHEGTNRRLGEFSSTLADHATRLQENEKQMAKAVGAAGVIAAGVGSGVSALWHWIAGKH